MHNATPGILPPSLCSKMSNDAWTNKVTWYNDYPIKPPAHSYQPIMSLEWGESSQHHNNNLTLGIQTDVHGFIMHKESRAFVSTVNDLTCTNLS